MTRFVKKCKPFESDDFDEFIRKKEKGCFDSFIKEHALFADYDDYDRHGVIQFKDGSIFFFGDYGGMLDSGLFTSPRDFHKFFEANIDEYGYKVLNLININLLGNKQTKTELRRVRTEAKAAEFFT